MAEFYEARDINYAARDRDVFKTSEIQSVTRFQLMTDDEKNCIVFYLKKKATKKQKNILRPWKILWPKEKQSKSLLIF